MLAWIVEAIGLPELFAAFPLTAEDLLAEVGITARAMRQAPFSSWRRGVGGCRPGLLFPGSNTNEREARYIGRVGLGLPTSAIDGLMGLAEDATRARAAPEFAAARGVLAPSPAAALGGEGSGARPGPAAPPGDTAALAAGAAGRTTEADAGARAIAAPADAEVAGPGTGGPRRTRSGGQQRDAAGALPSRRRSRTPSTRGSREQSRSGTPPQGASTDNPLDVVFDLLTCCSFAAWGLGSPAVGGAASGETRDQP